MTEYLAEIYLGIAILSIIAGHAGISYLRRRRRRLERHPQLDVVRDLALGELEPYRLADVLTHLDGCEFCREQLEVMIMLRVHRDLLAEACSSVARRARAEIGGGSTPPAAVM